METAISYQTLVDLYEPIDTRRKQRSNLCERELKPNAPYIVFLCFQYLSDSKSFEERGIENGKKWNNLNSLEKENYVNVAKRYGWTETI